MLTLVLGATGLLGQAVVVEARARDMATSTAAREGAEHAIDIADRVSLLRLLDRERPDLVFNCAAVADVAVCESDPARAYLVNAAAVAVMAEWCRSTGAGLIHVSTDHFLNGNGPVAQDEDAPIALLNVYAETKYAGERFALTAPRALTLRTSLVGLRGWRQPTFAEWAIDAIVNDRAVTLFADAFTSSIDVGSFARAALDLVDRGAHGLLNLAAAEVYSKEAFVRVLAELLGRPLSQAVTGSVALMNPPRPGGLGLDVGRAQRLLDWPLPDLQAIVRAISDAFEGTT